MAKSSIHIEAGSGGYFAHNSREAPTVNSVFSDEPNFCSCPKKVAFEIYRSELQIRSEAYTERTGQKLQKNAITHLSAIVNFNKEHTPEDMQRVCDLLERKFDTKVIQYAMHRDEGKSADDKNYHAHIEFMGLDSKGESVRRKLDRPTLKALQSEVAQTLGMTRGKDYAKERTPRPKRLDTYEYKAHAKAVEEVKIATEKDLKAEVAQLRSQLKEQGATRADYAELEKINRELREQIKAKDLTVDQLTTQLETVRSLNRYAESEKAELKAQIITKDETIDQLKSIPKEVQNHSEHDPLIFQKYADLEEENKLLKVENKGLERENTELKTKPHPQEVTVNLEPINEALKTPINDQAPTKYEITTAKERVDELRKYNGKMIINASKDDALIGKKLNEDRLERNIDKILNAHLKEHENAHSLMERLHKAKDAIIDSTKALVKRAEMALKTIFPQKERDLSSEPKKELTEQLQHSVRNRSEIIKEAQQTMQGFLDKTKDQGKENEKNQSRGMGLGR